MYMFLFSYGFIYLLFIILFILIFGIHIVNFMGKSLLLTPAYTNMALKLTFIVLILKQCHQKANDKWTNNGGDHSRSN